MSTVIPLHKKSPDTPDPPVGVGVVVGIDLGTTYSLVSVMQGGKPPVLPNGVSDTHLTLPTTHSM